MAHKIEWPIWWFWELDCQNPHLQKRMVDRQFSETDLRLMLENATGYEKDAVPGRFIIFTSWNGDRWDIIVEPDELHLLLVVVTAYKSE